LAVKSMKFLPAPSVMAWNPSMSDRTVTRSGNTLTAIFLYFPNMSELLQR
jgi:hypothetical protein